MEQFRNGSGSHSSWAMGLDLIRSHLAVTYDLHDVEPEGFVMQDSGFVLGLGTSGLSSLVLLHLQCVYMYIFSKLKLFLFCI